MSLKKISKLDATKKINKILEDEIKIIFILYKFYLSNSDLINFLTLEIFKLIYLYTLPIFFNVIKFIFLEVFFLSEIIKFIILFKSLLLKNLFKLSKF